MERNFQGASNRHRVSLSRDGTTAPLHCLIALCVAAFTVLYATICGISRPACLGYILGSGPRCGFARRPRLQHLATQVPVAVPGVVGGHVIMVRKERDVRDVHQFADADGTCNYCRARNWADQRQCRLCARSPSPEHDVIRDGQGGTPLSPQPRPPSVPPPRQLWCQARGPRPINAKAMPAVAVARPASDSSAGSSGQSTPAEPLLDTATFSGSHPCVHPLSCPPLEQLPREPPATPPSRDTWIQAMMNIQEMEREHQAALRRFRKVEHRVEQAQTRLRAASATLEGAQNQHRMAMEAEAMARSDVGGALKDISQQIANFEASRTAILSGMLRHMVQAVSSRNLPELLAQARQALTLLPQAELAAASTVRNSERSGGIWASHAPDLAAAGVRERRPVPRARSRSPRAAGMAWQEVPSSPE